MISPELTYTDEFFAEYGRTNPNYTQAAVFIAREIARRFTPKSAVDWGCGAGLHAAELMSANINVVAVDAVLPGEKFRAPGIDYVIADITQKNVSNNAIPSSYDLSLCIDVMEHLYEEDSDNALTNITKGAKLLILSCAPPGQGGHHHVNDQPRIYWVKRLNELGWRYERKETGLMERYFLQHRNILTLSWMYHNLCIYRPI